jgi:hypothetical protein
MVRLKENGIMAFDINEFVGSVNTGGVAKKSHFDVEINLQDITNTRRIQRFDARGFARNLSLRCETAELPGIQIATAEQKIYGPLQKMAYAGMYTDTSFSFLVSSNMREKVFFDDWARSIVGSQQFAGSSYNVGYFKDYSTTVDIHQYDTTGKITYSVRLFDAFPTTVAPIALDRSSNDIHRLNVTMTYRWWTSMNWADSQLKTGADHSNWFRRNSATLGALAGVVSAKLPPRLVQGLGAAGKLPSIGRNIFS